MISIWNIRYRYYWKYFCGASMNADDGGWNRLLNSGWKEGFLATLFIMTVSTRRLISTTVGGFQASTYFWGLQACCQLLSESVISFHCQYQNLHCFRNSWKQNCLINAFFRGRSNTKVNKHQTYTCYNFVARPKRLLKCICLAKLLADFSSKTTGTYWP